MTNDVARQGDRRKAWQPMKVTYVGHVGEVMRLGGGKLTVIAEDPGEEPRKTKPSG